MIIDDIKNVNDMPKNVSEVMEINVNIRPFNTAVLRVHEEDELDKKLITDIENKIRNSYEYREYINYLKTSLDLNRCNYHPHIDPSKYGLKIEIHHTPLTLYDIVDTMARHRLAKEGSFSVIELAQDVVKEHYQNAVGLTPVSRSFHKMIHNNSIVVPLAYINGNFDDFVHRYYDFMSEDVRDRYMFNKSNSMDLTALSINDRMMETKITYLNVNYLENDKEEEVINSINMAEMAALDAITNNDKEKL